jgi:hypothetical protein
MGKFSWCMSTRAAFIFDKYDNGMKYSGLRRLADRYSGAVFIAVAVTEGKVTEYLDQQSKARERSKLRTICRQKIWRDLLNKKYPPKEATTCSLMKM